MQRTKADYAPFMERIITTYYADIEYIDFIQDDLNTHKYGSFYEHLPVNDARLRGSSSKWAEIYDFKR
ncbi:hypothetical protein GCM10028807_62290 [Spirosoma daeguense]